MEGLPGPVKGEFSAPGFCPTEARRAVLIGPPPGFAEPPRMGGDSNPRYLAVNTLSRRAQSTTLPPIHQPRASGARKKPAPRISRERNSAAKMPHGKSDVSGGRVKRTSTLQPSIFRSATSASLRLKKSACHAGQPDCAALSHFPHPKCDAPCAMSHLR